MALSEAELARIRMSLGETVLTILVAASDALLSSRLAASPIYRCDGTADDVQIQAAVDALP